jgi:hypothetical protein
MFSSILIFSREIGKEAGDHKEVDLNIPVEAQSNENTKDVEDRLNNNDVMVNEDSEVDPVEPPHPLSLFCTLCKVNIRNTLLLPCGHVSICDSCAVSLEATQTCPSCRTRFVAKHLVLII